MNIDLAGHGSTTIKLQVGLAKKRKKRKTRCVWQVHQLIRSSGCVVKAKIQYAKATSTRCKWEILPPPPVAALSNKTRILSGAQNSPESFPQASIPRWPRDISSLISKKKKKKLINSTSFCSLGNFVFFSSFSFSSLLQSSLRQKKTRPYYFFFFC